MFAPAFAAAQEVENRSSLNVVFSLEFRNEECFELARMFRGSLCEVSTESQTTLTSHEKNPAISYWIILRWICIKTSQEHSAETAQRKQHMTECSCTHLSVRHDRNTSNVGGTDLGFDSAGEESHGLHDESMRLA